MSELAVPATGTTDRVAGMGVLAANDKIASERIERTAVEAAHDARRNLERGHQRHHARREVFAMTALLPEQELIDRHPPSDLRGIGDIYEAV
jgi:hypothetical protein